MTVTGKMMRGLAVAAMVPGVLAGASGVAEARPGLPGVAAAAPVPTGVVKVLADWAPTTGPTMTRVAKCPAGKKVVGGGGNAAAFDRGGRVTALTRLEPSDDVDGSGADGYVASGVAAPGGSAEWALSVYAMCADAASVPGWQLRAAYTDSASDAQKVKTIGCSDPTRQRVIGTGARVGIAPGHEDQVLLQTARASGSGDSARAQSHEALAGYTGGHWLGVYAICMNTPKGYDVVYGESAERLSESGKSATVECGSGRRVLHAGAGISTAAPGDVALLSTRVWNTQPSDPENQARISAGEFRPTGQNWDFVVAQAICVATS